MKIAVKYLDGRETVAQIIPFDTVQLERKYDVSIDDLETEGRIEHVLFLAWTSLSRTDMAAGKEFDAWAATVEDVDDGDAPEEADDKGDGAGEAPAAPDAAVADPDGAATS